MSLSSRTLVGAALTAVALASAVAAPALTGAQTAPAESQIVVREKVRDVHFVRTSRAKGDRLRTGDRVVTRQALFGSDDKPLGTLYTDCVNLGPAAAVFKATLQCVTTYRLARGSILVSGVITLGSPAGTEAAIIGGTGAYRGATGYATPGKPEKGYDSVDVLHLARATSVAG